MSREPLGRPLFAAGLIGCGAAGLVFRNVLVYQTFSTSSRLHTLLSILTAVLLAGAGTGLLSRWSPVASRVALVVLLLWDLIFSGLPVVKAPLDEGAWLELGMATMVVLAAWLLTGTARLRAARTILGLALVPVGLSHFFFWRITLDLVPAWLPAPAFWAGLVGVAHIAAGLGVLFGVFPRLAATLEAAQLVAFAILVWLPRVIAKPSVQFNWTEMLGTFLIGGAAWVTADALSGRPWLPAGPKA